ncbi:COP1-interactive protein 1-like isoform X4 [Pomacea canaliculata]|uniref:COP1-interactive protein 1-like isoform X4 n=1 Tax=Pomacea canaliculata TaxID=400727 RepID=UPI000D72670F|nr:COP1-interactive protein 1-like isoform X4 [Pomacea canaliculata]
MASKCRKFVPNMFNKSKCQACFGSKEAHSAEALESNKATRKVSKCGYLFVSPDLDFSNPLDRTRKWQRRFFRLYDDGELTFSVDENPDTVPQGSVDMNRCTDVLDAETVTTHQNSIAVVTPEKTEYFKANSKEEMQWWHDVLIEFPNNLKSIKPRRKPNLISNKENVQMARSSELSTTSRAQTQSASSASDTSPTKYEDLVYMKKGWLIKQGPSEKESRKHWFVLAGNSLRYFKDAKAEETNALDGRIDLSTCYEVSEVSMARHCGFKIKTQNGEYVLAAMTSGIRNNWMKAIRLCMDLHSSKPKLSLSSTLTGKALAGLSARAMDDFDVGGNLRNNSPALPATTVVTGAKGETAFQLVGQQDSGKKEPGVRNIRRHYSDVNPSNVGQIFSIKEFNTNIDTGGASASQVTTPSKIQPTISSNHTILDSAEKTESVPRASKIPRQHSPSVDSILWNQAGGPPISRYVEGSDGVISSLFHPAESRRSKRNIITEISKEEEKREIMRRAKSPSARVKEKSRGAKTPRLHSPPPEDDGFDYHPSSSGHGTAGSSTKLSQSLSDTEDDLDTVVSSEDPYTDTDGGLEDNTDGGLKDAIGDDILVEMLESEVESLKERLDKTQNQLVKMHETNIDLKSRLQKESSQSLDGSFGNGRWSQQGGQQIDQSQVQTMKRQLKEAKDTVQKQRMEIEGLKSKLDMSVSKLTGTEKALSEALREYKQEKDKFLKLSSEWNRRIRSLEGQLKDNVHKLEKARESLQSKEREGRQLEIDMKGQQQKTREQDREILKLKAVEHEYNHLKERLDNKERELQNARSELRDKESQCDKLKLEFKRQVSEMEHTFGRERDELETQVDELKEQLHSYQERHSTLQDNITTNMADLLSEKDDIIAQLEEKLIENDRKMVDMNEELQAEMSENSDLIHNIDVLQEEKQTLQNQISTMERQLLSLRDKVATFEKDNDVLRQHLDQLKNENTKLAARLSRSSVSSAASEHDDPEKEELQKTVLELNKQIQSLQLKLIEKFEDLDQKKSCAEKDDLLHIILIFDSDLKEVNSLLTQLQDHFDAYLAKVPNDIKKEAATLAEMVEEINHHCLLMQGSLHESSQGRLSEASGEDYHHNITVDASSGGQKIMDEYQGLKGKFDRAVAELKKLKKEVNEVYRSYDKIEKKDKQLEQDMQQMETSYREQLENIVRRVDQLSSQLANSNSTAALQAKLGVTAHHSVNTSMSTEIENQLSQLDNEISSMEKALAEKTASNSLAAESRMSLSPQDSQCIMSRLKEMKEQLELTNSGLKEILCDVVSSPGVEFQEASKQQSLMSHIDGCGRKLGKLANMIQEEGDFAQTSRVSAGSCSGGGCPGFKDSGASSMAQCMCEVKERIQEIGELLDSLEDNAEDSDNEEGETTTVDDVRERLSSLCEFVEQHHTFSTYDWHLMQLLNAQKVEISKTRAQQSDAGDGVTDAQDKLHDYANRLSLEALILVEMAHLLEQKAVENKEESEEEEEHDPLLKMVGGLSLKLLSLHQKLEQECRTLQVENVVSDVLAMQADLIAEKILMEGVLFSGTFGHNLSLNEEKDKKVQHKLLATEALMRSQLDAFIGKNLDKTCDELWSSASHLTLRSLVQGELTFALNCLKKRLSDCTLDRESKDCVKNLFIERLKERHKLVMGISKAYEDKIIKALAIIISKESEEMTIVEGPENVLDTVCSEVSTIMEKHIQQYKEKIRSAKTTESAHQWDKVVSQLRLDRESVVAGIREQHAAISAKFNEENSLEVPFQSLDSTINNFGEILSLRSVLTAQLSFIDELAKVGDTALLDDIEEEEEEDASDGEAGAQRTLHKGLVSFMHNLTTCLQREAGSRQDQAVCLLSSKGQNQVDVVSAVPELSSLLHGNQYSETLTREAIFAAQITFMMCKMKLLHEQELDRLRASRPARQQNTSLDGSQDGEIDVYSLLGPLEDVMDTKYDDEMETLRVIASHVGKLKNVLGESGSTQDWAHVNEHVQKLEQKLQEELSLAQQRHEAHIDLFKQEETKVEQAWEGLQQERELLEERCSALESELQSISTQHDDEVERMRQDVLTAVSAIRANEEESETQLSDRLQRMTKQIVMQKENFKRFLSKVKECLSEDGKSHESLWQLVDQELKTVNESQLSELSEDEELPPLPSQPPPSLVQRDDKSLNVEEELELLKKEKDEALAEETRNTKAALDAMKKAYEEELQHERDKYKEILTTMYNEDFVNEIRRRHETELERLKEELKQVKMHYLSKCEDYKLMEIKMEQTKQDYESHINQLITSNAHLDDMVNQEIDRLKDFIKNRPANLTTGSATLEEELYDAQIMTRVKDAELQKLRSQVKNLENSLHRTTEEHRQTMTQYLQALKENQELRKEYQLESTVLRDQLEKLQGESGLRRPIRRAPSFHQRARSPSPQSAASQRKESTSSTTEHISRDSNRRRRLEPRDLRRSKSSPSLPYVFDAKGVPTALKPTVKGIRSVQPKT